MTKEQERSELHRTIWKIANDLRGSGEVDCIYCTYLADAVRLVQEET